MENSVIERKQMECRTVNNGVDYGIFTMRHMESYMVKFPRTCGFVKEGDKYERQDSQLRLLRNRYLHTSTTPKIIEDSNAFHKRPDRESFMQDLDKKIDARLDGYFGGDNKLSNYIFVMLLT
ncbi:hypothetical protein Hanom_Chr14g01249661 [Helianthus anomalus]